jgi:hypothetical protein
MVINGVEIPMDDELYKKLQVELTKSFDLGAKYISESWSSDQHRPEYMRALAETAGALIKLEELKLRQEEKKRKPRPIRSPL